MYVLSEFPEHDLLTPEEVAKILSVSVHTLRRWRYERKGPPFIKIENRLVRYSSEELFDYMLPQWLGEDE